MFIVLFFSGKTVWYTCKSLLFFGFTAVYYSKLIQCTQFIKKLRMEITYEELEYFFKNPP